MKAYQINRVLVVAAVAFLPIACGTSSPTGPDFASDATASALRTAPMPPQAPEAPSPEQVPNPVPSPKPTPDPTSVDTAPPAAPTETTETTETTDRRSGRPVAPQPEPSADVNEPDVDTAGPAVQPGVETGRTVPAPRPAGTNPGDTGSVPVPPVVKCDAFSLEILNVTTFAPTSGLALEAVLKGKDGLAITDSSCETLLWAAEGPSSSTRVVITHGSNSRYVTVTGLVTGTYKIGVTAPNHVTTSVSISVQ